MGFPLFRETTICPTIYGGTILEVFIIGGIAGFIIGGGDYD